MPRRKKDESSVQADSTPEATATDAAPATPEVAAAEASPAPDTPAPDAPADGQQANGQHAGPPPAAGEGGQPRQWGNPYKAVFTCPAKRFELGENRRFKQMVFTFPENPGPEVTQKLKDAGFTYRAGEKAWTIPATAASRETATKLAMELKGDGQGQGMSR